MTTKLYIVAALMVIFQGGIVTSYCGSQTRPNPITTGVRKSFLGGSYVLEVRNTSESQITFWLEAKGKLEQYTLQSRGFKDIGWAQGFRFDANDALFIWADGCDTLRMMMPIDELSPWRIGFAEGGGLKVSLSQSFVQGMVSKQANLPIEQAYRNIVQVSLVEMPQFIFQDGSSRVFAEAPIVTNWFKSFAKMVIKTRISFVPQYEPHTGTLFASDLQVESLEVNLVPGEWLNDFKEVANQLLVSFFRPVSLFQLESTLLKYARLFSVRDVVVRDGRLEIHFL